MTYTLEDQVALETEARLEAIRRYRLGIQRAKERGLASDCKHVEAMTRRVLIPFQEGVSKWLCDSFGGKPGRAANSCLLVQCVSPDVLSLIVVKVVLDKLLCAPIKNKQTAVFEAVGRAVEDQTKFDSFEDQQPALWHTIMKSVSGNDRRHKRTVANLSMSRFEIEWTPWSNKDRILLGASLVSILIETTGLIHSVTHRNGRKSQTNIYLEDDAVSYLSDSEEFFSSLMALNEPTIIPPRPWTSTLGGGYYDPERKETKLLKGWSVGESLAEFNGHDISQITSSLNAVQDTAWRVNRDVLDVFDYVVEMGLDLGDLPPEGNVPLPPNLPEDQLTDEVKKKVRKDRYQIYTINRARRSKRLQIRLCRQACKKFVDYPAIYMPHQLDFRGRMYAMPAALHPQGPDYMKGLLTFSEGLPIETQEQADWLAIHLANCFGFDKVSFADRIQWVEEHLHRIHAVAGRPKSYHWWCVADDPWQFLAACFEYSAFREQGFGFVSHLPVHVDGSCNGIQHYSAILRDSVGGKATNLIPSDEPSDIYQEVCDAAILRLQTEQDADKVHLAEKWLGLGLTRKTTKRPVMVLPYGGTISSTRKYIEESYRESLEGKLSPFGSDEEGEAISYLSSIVWASMGDVVVAGRCVMDWLRKLAGKVSEEGEPIRWTTPSGFKALQMYAEQRDDRIETRILGNLKTMRIGHPTDKPHKNRQKNGLPPNFIHSLDATHLVFTINGATSCGIKSITAVHDSYGCHAANMPTLSRILREEFVRLYTENDPLGDLYESYKHIQGVEPPPSKGSLDIEQVTSSPYFFA